MKQILFTVLALIISTVMVAQNNSSGKQSTPPTSNQSNSAVLSKDNKKIHYVEKRAKPVQVNSGSKSKVVTQKKPVRVAVKKDKVFSK